MQVLTLSTVHQRQLGDTVAWIRGRAVSLDQLLSDAQRLAQSLPAQGPALNLCQDRYHFAVGLLAALSRRHVSLMPPNALPETLACLNLDGRAPYALIDDEAALSVSLHLHPVIVSKACGAAAQPQVSLPEPEPTDPVVCLLTSGSTGSPTAHVKRWDDLRANIAAEAARLAQMLELPSLAGTTLVGTVPPQHSYGLESTVLLALLGGAAFESGRPFFPADIVDALSAVPRPRALVTTPFHLKTLLDSGLELPPTDLVLCATAPLSPQLAARAEGALGARLIEIYGCTEAGQVASRRTTQGDAWTALQGLSLHQRTQGSEDPPESFWVEGGHVREPTRLADLLVLESPTRFRLLGRANDLIHVGGKRSSMGHLNFQLNRIPGVVDGAMWMPQEQADGITRPVAFVVAPGLDSAQVIRCLRQTLEPVFVPRTVIFLDALPRSDTGKITTSALTRLAQHHGLVAADGGDDVDDAQWQRIEPEHPAFEGHFPGQPILPGVVLLGHVQRAFSRRLAHGTQDALPVIQVEQVKFLRFVEPGDEIRILLEPAAREHACSFVVEVRRPALPGQDQPAADAAARGVISASARP